MEALVEDVLRNGEVEGPQRDRPKEHEVRRGARDAATGAHLATLAVPGNPPNEGVIPAPMTDVIEVPLRVVIWLLLSSVVGGGIGLAIAHRPGAIASVDASAPVVVARAGVSNSAPQLVYWNVRRHLALDVARPASGRRAMRPRTAKSSRSAQSRGHSRSTRARPAPAPRRRERIRLRRRPRPSTRRRS